MNVDSRVTHNLSVLSVNSGFRRISKLKQFWNRTLQILRPSYIRCMCTCAYMPSILNAVSQNSLFCCPQDASHNALRYLIAQKMTADKHLGALRWPHKLPVWQTIMTCPVSLQLNVLRAARPAGDIVLNTSHTYQMRELPARLETEGGSRFH